MPVAADYLTELKTRLQNPAVSDADLLVYINAAFRDVDNTLYSPTDFDAQVLDTACLLLSQDNKFPDIQSISSQGVSTSFASNDPTRWLKRINSRRAAVWMR